MKSKKEIIVNHIQKILDTRIETAIRDIEMAIESRDNETKSTVGDKYETGRSMVQFELEKYNDQLNKAIQLKNELLQIDLHKNYTRVEFGSIVFTKNDCYFISIGLGKIEINNQTWYSISLASPIGQALFNKSAGDKIKFQGKEIVIIEIA